MGDHAFEIGIVKATEGCATTFSSVAGWCVVPKLGESCSGFANAVESFQHSFEHLEGSGVASDHSSMDFSPDARLGVLKSTDASDQFLSVSFDHKSAKSTGEFRRHLSGGGGRGVLECHD